MKWDNFNKRKHLNLKSKEVYDEKKLTEEDAINESSESSPSFLTTVDDIAEEVEQPIEENESIKESSIMTEKLKSDPESYDGLSIATHLDEEDPDKAARAKAAKIKSLKNAMKKSNKWNWISFVPYALLILGIGILFFTLTLTNPVGELLYVLSIFAGLYLILGFVSSIKAIASAKKLKRVSEDDADRALAKKMINKSVVLLILYILLPTMLTSGLFIFGA